LAKATVALLVVALVALVVVAGVQIVKTGEVVLAEPDTITIRGSLTVADTCPPTGGFADIHDGTSVTIGDASGTVIALGKLEGGIRDTENSIYLGCRYAFAVRDVPVGHDFYRVQIGNERRGELTVPAAEAEVPLSLTLGY